MSGGGGGGSEKFEVESESSVLLLVPKLELGNAFALEAPASSLCCVRWLPLRIC